MNDAVGSTEGGGRRTGFSAANLEGDKVWLDVQSAVAATRPNVNVGGVINPEQATFSRDDAAREPPPYHDALYDIEKGLAFLRRGNYGAVPDFAKALNPRGDVDADFDGESRCAALGPGGRNPAAPDFYDVGDVDATAYPRGAGGALAFGAPQFSKAAGRGDDFFASAAPPGFADGDRIDLDPVAADGHVYPRGDKGVPDISEAGQSGRPTETTPPLTRDVDWLYERHLASAYPRLTAGTGAVDFSRPGGGHDDAGVAARPQTDDLDAGCYHDESTKADASALTTERRRAVAVDFARGPSKATSDQTRAWTEGDALVLHPTDPAAPRVGAEAECAAARAAADPVGAFNVGATRCTSNAIV